MNLPMPFRLKPGEVLNIVCCVVIGFAFAGFMVGISEKHEPVQPAYAAQAESSGGEVEPAVNYREIKAQGRGMNRDWSVNLTTLVNKAPGVFEPVPTPSEAMKQVSLEKRSSRRAYDGAPPLIPHQIDQRTADNCLLCHGEGMQFATVTAPKISHEPYANCTQCHVEMENPQLSLFKETDNRFEGRQPPQFGKRAWQGAPPVMPHSTHMRQDCRSCHGVNGLPGIRTTHPERQNCIQCHAPSAELNQQPLLPPRLVLNP